MDPDTIAMGVGASLTILFLLLTTYMWWTARKERKAKKLNILRARFSAIDLELTQKADEAEDITDNLLLGAVGDQIQRFSAPAPGNDSDEAAYIAVMTAVMLAETLRQYIEYELAKPLLLERDAIEMQIASRSERKHIRARAKQAEEAARVQQEMLWQAQIDLGQLEHLRAVTV